MERMTDSSKEDRNPTHIDIEQSQETRSKKQGTGKRCKRDKTYIPSQAKDDSEDSDSGTVLPSREKLPREAKPSNSKWEREEEERVRHIRTQKMEDLPPFFMDLATFQDSVRDERETCDYPQLPGWSTTFTPSNEKVAKELSLGLRAEYHTIRIIKNGATDRTLFFSFTQQMVVDISSRKGRLEWPDHLTSQYPIVELELGSLEYLDHINRLILCAPRVMITKDTASHLQLRCDDFLVRSLPDTTIPLEARLHLDPQQANTLQIIRDLREAEQSLSKHENYERTQLLKALYEQLCRKSWTINETRVERALAGLSGMPYLSTKNEAVMEKFKAIFKYRLQIVIFLGVVYNVAVGRLSHLENPDSREKRLEMWRRVIVPSNGSHLELVFDTIDIPAC